MVNYFLALILLLLIISIVIYFMLLIYSANCKSKKVKIGLSQKKLGKILTWFMSCKFANISKTKY